MISRIARVGRVARAGGGAGFNPIIETSFVFGLEASPLYCFSDSTGLTPCNVDDDIGCWKSKSGTAISFIQALAASTVRKFRQDASGKYYVEFGGGANDYLTASTVAGLNGAAGGCMGLACRPGTQANSLFGAVAFGTGASTDTFMILRGDGTALQNTKWQSNVAGQSVGTNATDSVAYTQAADVRIIGRVDPVTLQTHRIWKNGSQVGTTARSAGMPTTTGTLAIGTDAGVLSRLFIGRIYGLYAFNSDLSESSATGFDTLLRGLMP